MATLKDIAEAAGVSIYTVSRVLNGKNKEVWGSATRRAAEIRQIAERLNYMPNAAARAMAGDNRTRQVGVLFRNEDKPGFRYINLAAFEMVLGINERLRTKGYVTSLIHIGDVRDLRSESRVFTEHLLDGMIVVGNTPKTLAHQLPRRIKTCLWLDSDVWGKHNCIRRDETDAGHQATRALVQAGARKIAWWSSNANPDERHYSAAERYKGVADAADEAGAELATCDFLPWADNDRGVALLREHLRAGYAIVANDYLTARWVAHASGTLGLNPGIDYRLACCDDTRETISTWPDLARVTFDRFAMGVAAAEMLLKLLDQPDAKVPSRRLSGEWTPGATAGLRAGDRPVTPGA